MLKFYNTLTNQKEEFKPLNPPEVKMYNCGPTVYGYAHIGNFSSYLMADLIRRYLEYLGYQVKQVKNITDVGHLVADADEGEDKMEKAAREQQKDPYEIARFYEKAYLADEAKLKMAEPYKRPRATEHVTEMIEIIKVLLNKEFAYETSDGIYFDISKFPNYGQLSGNTLDQIQAGKRVEINENKRHPYDFALWKKLVGDNKNHIMKWNSPWGEGFPGWHIECSAMARKYLGDQIDIHTGGEDNIFPHHECEIAQSEGFSGKQYVKYWLHKRWFFVEGQKMSKSLGNIYTIADIEKMGFDPLDLRYLFLSVHYRAKLNFTQKGLEDAKLNRQKFNNLIQKLQSISDPQKGLAVFDLIRETKQQFEEAMNDDLNTSGALGVLFSFLKEVNKRLRDKSIRSKEAQEILDFLTKVNQVFMVFDFAQKNERTPETIMNLLEKRNQARKEKDFGLADSLRDEIMANGYSLKDNPDGTTSVQKI